jgi:hypothetical protein
MKIFIKSAKIAILLLFFILFPYYSFSQSSDSGTVTIQANVPGCGDGIIQSGEQCDGSNLGGQTCQSKGFSGGILSCNSNCTFNTSQCTIGGGGGSGGGGGGGGASLTQVIFSGRAYPKSTVTLLKDAQVAVSTIADNNAAFSITLSNLSGGNYIFSIYSEDNQGRRSSLLNFPVSVTSGATTKIEGIFIAPTIAADKIEVKKGDNIAIFGQSAPNSEITIVVNSEEEIFVKTSSDKNGVYLHNLDTSPLSMEQHFAKSKAALKGEITSFSQAISFIVGNRNVFAQFNKCPQKADLNGDCKVNLVDFSIAAYWYKRIISAEFAIKEKEKLNGDGKIDLVDFSIMAYYWTG